jgi:hypothetical protein
VATQDNVDKLGIAWQRFIDLIGVTIPSLWRRLSTVRSRTGGGTSGHGP